MIEMLACSCARWLFDLASVSSGGLGNAAAIDEGGGSGGSIEGGSGDSSRGDSSGGKWHWQRRRSRRRRPGVDEGSVGDVENKDLRRKDSGDHLVAGMEGELEGEGGSGGTELGQF